MTYGLEHSPKWNSAAQLFAKNPLNSVNKNRIDAHRPHISTLETHIGAFSSTKNSFHNLQSFRDMGKDSASAAADADNIDNFKLFQDKAVSNSSEVSVPSGLINSISVKDQFNKNLQDGQALFSQFLNTPNAKYTQTPDTNQISSPISVESIQYKTFSVNLLKMFFSVSVVICMFIIKMLTLMVNSIKRETENLLISSSNSDGPKKKTFRNVAADDTHIALYQDSNINTSTPINSNSIFKKVFNNVQPKNHVQAKLLNAQFGTPSGISSPIISDFISPGDMGTPIDHQPLEKQADASNFKWHYDTAAGDDSQPLAEGGYGTHFYTSKRPNSDKGAESNFLKKVFAKDTTILDLAPVNASTNSMEIWEGSRFIASKQTKINDMFELTQRLRASLMTEEKQEIPTTKGVFLDSFLKRNDLLISKKDTWTGDTEFQRLEDDYETYQAIMQEKKKREELIQLEKSSVFPLVKPLKMECLKLVQKYWNSKDLAKKIVSGISAEVFVRDLKTLINSRWINDSVIDFYLSLISNRSSQRSSLPSVFAFTTHFYTTFTSRGYEGVKRWAKRKKVDITKLDYVFVPINILNSHWALGVIDNRRKRFQYYDSLKGQGRTPVLNNLKTFALKESERIYGNSAPVNFHEYLLDYDTKSPQQKNGSDCGVFTCATVEFISREKALQFSQTDMPLIRQRMAYEIITGELLE